MLKMSPPIQSEQTMIFDLFFVMYTWYRAFRWTFITCWFYEKIFYFSRLVISIQEPMRSSKISGCIRNIDQGEFYETVYFDLDKGHLHYLFV